MLKISKMIRLSPLLATILTAQFPLNGSLVLAQEGSPSTPATTPSVEPALPVTPTTPTIEPAVPVTPTTPTTPTVEPAVPVIPTTPTTPPVEPVIPVPPSVEPSPVSPPGATPETPPAQEAKVLVGEVLVSGADKELENLVYNTIRTRPGRTTTRSQLQEDINAIYATGFFSNVTVTPQDTPLGVRITFAVEQNPVLNSIKIDTVPTSDTKQVLPQEVVNDIFKDQYGKILNLKDLQNSVRQINEWYSQNGYDLAQVIGAPQVGRDGVVTLVIAEGLIEDIRVRFITKEDEPTKGKTREFIVTREMQLKPGMVFNRNTAQRDLQRIFGLGLFEDARLSFEPGSDPREVIVNVNVVEGNSGSLAAGAGISSNSGLFGTVSYQERNFGGNNQIVGVQFQIGQRELLFDFSFTDPWIATDPYRTSYTVNLFRRRSISLVYDGDNNQIETANGNDSPRIVRTGGGVTFVRPIAADVFSRPDWLLSAGFQYQHVEVVNAEGDISPISNEENDSQFLAFSPSGIDDIVTVSFAAVRDYRNSPLQPTSGSLLRLGTEQSIPIGSGSIFFNRMRANYSYYIPVRLLNPVNFFNTDFLTGQQSLAFNAQAGGVFGDLPPYEAFILGGSNSVRGYAEGEVGSGRYYFQATAEYRFPIIPILGGALFVDYGTTIGSQGAVPGRPGEIRNLPGSGLGYGVGVRIQSPVGPIRVDYGFNDQGSSTIHFGIGERF